MIFPEESVEPRAVLKLRIEFLDYGFGASPFRRHVAR
jgi:hypothetical protein